MPLHESNVGKQILCVMLTHLWIRLICVPQNHPWSQCGARLHVFEDNEAVNQMVTKGRSSNLRHVTPEHFEWIWNGFLND